MSHLYAVRDHMEQGEYYLRHVSAMTGEGLHAKSAIAAELAYRDIEIERQSTNTVNLAQQVADLRKDCADAGNALAEVEIENEALREWRKKAFAVYPNIDLDIEDFWR